MFKFAIILFLATIYCIFGVLGGPIDPNNNPLNNNTSISPRVVKPRNADIPVENRTSGQAELVRNWESEISCGQYIISQGSFDWENAKLYCGRMNMKLVSLLSREIESSILGCMDSNGVTQIWTGGYDGMVDGQYTWQTNRDIIQLSYTNWINSFTPKSPDQNCVFLGTNANWPHNERAGWDVTWCNNQKRFVCEPAN